MFPSFFNDRTSLSFLSLDFTTCHFQMYNVRERCQLLNVFQEIRLKNQHDPFRSLYNELRKFLDFSFVITWEENEILSMKVVCTFQSVPIPGPDFHLHWFGVISQYWVLWLTLVGKSEGHPWHCLSLRTILYLERNIYLFLLYNCGSLIFCARIMMINQLGKLLNNFDLNIEGLYYDNVSYFQKENRLQKLYLKSSPAKNHSWFGNGISLNALNLISVNSPCSLTKLKFIFPHFTFTRKSRG